MPATIPTIQRTGILFRPGNYGKKGNYSEADIDAMAGAVNAPIKMSHFPTLLDGKLGVCEEAFVGFDDKGQKVLMGRWAEPKPLADLLGDTPRSLSVEIDLTTKQLAAVALEVQPHIKDAAFFSQAVEDAYAKFSRGEEIVQFAFESATERDAIPDEDFGDPVNKLYPCRTQSELRQCFDELANAADPTAVRDRLVEIAERKGLKIPENDWRWSRGVSKPLADYALYSKNSQEKPPMNEATATTQEQPKAGIVERVLALFTSATPEERTGMQDALTLAQTGKTKREIELEAEVAKFKEDAAASTAQSAHKTAEAKVDALVEAGHIEAKGNELYNSLLAAFSVAGIVDAQSDKTAYFSGDWEPRADFSLTKTLEELTKSLPKVNGTEQVASGDPELFAAFGQEETTVTDPETGEMAKFNQEYADKLLGVKTEG